VDSFLDKTKISTYSTELRSLFNDKIPSSFFTKVPIDVLKGEIDKTNFRIIEKLLEDFESLSQEEKSKMMEKLEHSIPVTQIMEKYKLYSPESPEIQLKSFITIIDKLGQEGFAELARTVLTGDRLKKLVKEVENLSIKDQSLLIKNVPKAARLLSLSQTLEESLHKFKKIIIDHKKSMKKKEGEIHSFLADNYWLLGIEYFDRVIDTSINEFGKKINETKFYNFTAIPDFTIKLINGNEDECVVIELEAPNDKIFKDDGNLSKEVFDGINQAMIYVVLKRVEKQEARGITIIGSFHELDNKKIEQIRILRNSYPLIKILTYEDMIINAETVIRFLEKYKPKSEL